MRHAVPSRRSPLATRTPIRSRQHRLVVPARPLILAGLLMIAAGEIAVAKVAPDPSPSQALIMQHVEAGEFAPAIHLTRRLPAGSSRDRLWAEIAVAQTRSGISAADQVLREIEDDRVRGDAVARVREIRFQGQPFLAQFDDGGGGGDINSQADFDAVIELIQNTIEPDTWEEAGGTGRIAEFETGVRVDASGQLHRLLAPQQASALVRLRRSSAQRADNSEARTASQLRKVSLPRLERQVQLRLAAGHKPTSTMRVLAGLQRIQYVFVYPEKGDLVLAGPAGNWRESEASGPVSTATGRPLLQLDDLVVLLRMLSQKNGILFGCAITPTQEGLARTQALAERSRNIKLAKGEPARQRWVGEIRDTLGPQTIDVYGVDPRTRVAQVIVAADYHMKLVGMGLEPGAGNVVSYLDSIELADDEAPPDLGVLRWWFTLNYKAIEATNEGHGFALRGQGVQVLSENERLSAEGKRIHTGKSDQLTAGFAQSFTRNFSHLMEKYPMYADLQNVFDLALVAALLRDRQLPAEVGWHLTCFGDQGQYAVALGEAPRSVESVINYRAFPAGQIIAGVSGGVRVDPAELVDAESVRVVKRGALVHGHRYAQPPDDVDRWWWD